MLGRSSTLAALVLAALVPGTVVCLASCRQVLGIEPRKEGAAPLTLGEDCGACVDSTCPEAERACAADPECAEAAACMAAAGPDNIIGRATCREEHATAVASAAFEQIDACMRSACQISCFGDKGFFARYPDECDSCTTNACLDSMADCIADRACEDTAFKAIGDPEDINPPDSIPFMQALNAQAHVRALRDCTVDNCDGPCGFGSNLSCVSSYEWPEPHAGVANIEFFVHKFGSASENEPLEGALVEFCDDGVGECAPLESGHTDPTGSVAVQLKIASLTGYRGFVRISDGLSGLELYPTHVHRARPISADQRYGQYVPERATIEAGAEKLAGGQDPQLGVLGVLFLDCANEFVRGMKLELPQGALEGVTVFYPDGGDVTGELGVGVLNIKPGCHELEGKLDGVTTHRTKIDVPPGVFTVVYVSPLSNPEYRGDFCTPMFDWDGDP